MRGGSRAGDFVGTHTSARFARGVTLVWRLAQVPFIARRGRTRRTGRLRDRGSIGS